MVKELIVYYPKDTYILTLAGIYSELGDTKKQLALVEVLYEKGLLNFSFPRHQPGKPLPVAWPALQGGRAAGKGNG